MAAGTKDEETLNADRKRLEKATKHPVRKAMLEELDKRPMGPSELVEALAGSSAAITYHYRVLETLGYLPRPDLTSA